MATHLARTCDATAGSGYSQKWTWSGWVKRAKLGAEQGIMGNQRSDNNTNSRFKLYFRSTDKLGWECKDSGGSDDSSFETNMLFRDTNAWYHITFIYDSDNSTATERIKCYVNGKDVRTELGGFSSDNQASSGFGTLWSSSVVNYLGTSGNNSGIAMQFEGCMSHCHLTYGQRYEASTFGETDSTTGEWKILTGPSVTYGTQGYFMLKDNANVTDQSGEGNNFTATGSLTKSEDNPSNVFATLSPDILPRNSGETIANANLTFGTSAAIWNTESSAFGITKGKYYFEMKLNDNGTDRRFRYGLQKMAEVTKTGENKVIGGTDNNAIGYATQGESATQGSYIINQTATTMSDGDINVDGAIYGFAIDLDGQKMYGHMNGSWFHSGNPTAGTGAIDVSSFYTVGEPLFPSFTVHNSTININFGNGYFGTTAVSSAGTNASGNGIFEYDVPAGFTAISTKGINI